MQSVFDLIYFLMLIWYSDKVKNNIASAEFATFYSFSEYFTFSHSSKLLKSSSWKAKPKIFGKKKSRHSNKKNISKTRGPWSETSETSVKRPKLRFYWLACRITSSISQPNHSKIATISKTDCKNLALLHFFQVLTNAINSKPPKNGNLITKFHQN